MKPSFLGTGAVLAAAGLMVPLAAHADTTADASPTTSSSPTVSTSPTPTCTSTAPNDLNNDGQADTVIAQPKANVRSAQAAGAVDVRVSNGGSFRLTASSVGAGTSTAGVKFGQSVALGDLNGDCYADILIGVPRANGSSGQVVYVPGNANGVDLGATQVISLNNTKSSDRFGHAITIGNGTAYISAPYYDSNGLKNVGQIYVFQLQDGEFKQQAVLQQGSGVIKDTPEAGDHYGEVLAMHDNVLGVGVPDENVDGAVDAGAVHLTTFSATDPTKAESDVFLSQNTPGVPGGAEKGDNFGAAIDDQLLAIGVPGEDIKSTVDAGGIVTQVSTVLSGTPALRWVSQSSHGIPGKSKPGDKFGTSLVSGNGFLCSGKTGIAVGIPYKKVGKKTNVGMVTVVSQGTTDCGSLRGRKYTQESPGVAGNMVKGNRFGYALYSLPGTESDGALVGVPGANLDDKKNTGRVVNGVNLPTTSLRALGGLQAHTNYGNIGTGR